MTRHAGPFDIFLRTGFTGASGAPPQAPASVQTYSLASPFYEVLEPIARGHGRYVLFADEIVNMAEATLEAVAAELERREDVVALTSSSDALRKLHGAADAPHLAPWFAAVKRSFLEDSGLLGYKYQTLEFFLCEISDRLTRTSDKVCVSQPLGIDVDYRLWARDLLLCSSSRLASDCEIFESAHRHDSPRLQCPPQFRVRITGNYMDTCEATADPGPPPVRQPSRPTFSVICPAFKSKYFAQAVQSVIGQTWTDWEFVVVIDGPQEHEREKIASVLEQHTSDPRVRFYVQQNAGTGPTRRRLVELAQGDFIVSLDDDDVFHCDVLKVFARAIACNPDHAVFRAGAQLFGLHNAYLPPRQRAVVNGIPADLFEATQPFAIARSAFASLGGFDGDKSFGEAGEDSDLFLKIDTAGLKTSLIDLPLYSRRLSTVNQTLTFSPDECGAHVRSLLERHRPEGWQCSDLHFERDGDFIRTAISYRGDDTGREVVTATRFFDYQTLGESSNTLIDLEITSLCNAVCPFCPREVLDRTQRFIAMDLVESLADQIRQERGRRQVILCGIGESTLHPELTTIVKTLADAGAKVCMTTNGGLMNVEKFRALVDAGMVEFNFSLNAATAPTHQKVMHMKNFAKIQQNFASILDYKHRHHPEVEIHASFVFCTHNQHEVLDFVEQWRDTPVSQIWIHPVNGRAGLLGEEITAVDITPVQQRFAHDDRVLVDVFSHTRDDGDLCKIAHSLDFISVDGDMLLCALDYKRSVRLGNLRDAPLRTLHLNKVLKYIRREINEICHGCDFCPSGESIGGRPDPPSQPLWLTPVA